MPTPTDPEQREAIRRRLIDEETVRVVAVHGRTRIVENRLGLVAAAAGVDASNVRTDEIALLPLDPDASARGLRERFAAAGRDVGVLITDTQGRAWRNGVVDVAIGAAGVEVLADHRGKVDAFGNQLVVTQVAVGDEIAAAAELVKGKLAAVPVAVLRGWPAGPEQPATVLLRPAGRGPVPARHRPGHGPAAAPRRCCSGAPCASSPATPVDPAALDRAVGAALTAPAPHHTRPVRFVRVHDRRDALLDAMRAAWEADLAADGWSADRIARRVARGAVLRDATEIVVPFVTGEGRHGYPDARRRTPRSGCSPWPVAPPSRGCWWRWPPRDSGSAWISSTLFVPDVVRRGAGRAGRLGAARARSASVIRPSR